MTSRTFNLRYSGRLLHHLDPKLPANDCVILHQILRDMLHHLLRRGGHGLHSRDLACHDGSRGRVPEDCCRHGYLVSWHRGEGCPDGRATCGTSVPDGRASPWQRFSRHHSSHHSRRTSSKQRAREMEDVQTKKNLATDPVAQIQSSFPPGPRPGSVQGSLPPTCSTPFSSAWRFAMTWSCL